MGKTFVIGDIHGAYIPLKQCLERSGFNKEEDLLITLGDICDGWPYVYECVIELLTIKNRVDIRGNHDAWFKTWLDTCIHPDFWRQGGRGTKVSYLRGAGLWDENLAEERWLGPKDVPVSHWDFFHRQNLYYKDNKDRLFIHAGFYRFKKLTEQRRIDADVFYWDRDMWQDAISLQRGDELNFKENFSEIFIGHTHCATPKLATFALPIGDPVYAPKKADIIYNLDTGAGSHGKLTIMDVDSKKYWQSDLVNDVYGNYKPR